MAASPFMKCSMASKAFTGIWDVFQPLLAEQRYTINCNQGWFGDVEWVFEVKEKEECSFSQIFLHKSTCLLPE